VSTDEETTTPPQAPPIFQGQVNIDFAPNNGAFIDFENGTLRGTAGPTAPTATEDVQVTILDFGGPWVARFADAQGAGNVTGNCAVVADLTTLGTVDEGALGATAQADAGDYFAFKTVEGNYVLGEADYDAPGVLSVRWMIAAIPLVNRPPLESGSALCHDGVLDVTEKENP
jgi:hypothetical protein